MKWKKSCPPSFKQCFCLAQINLKDIKHLSLYIICLPSIMTRLASFVLKNAQIKSEGMSKCVHFNSLLMSHFMTNPAAYSQCVNILSHSRSGGPSDAVFVRDYGDCITVIHLQLLLWGSQMLTSQHEIRWNVNLFKDFGQPPNVVPFSFKKKILAFPSPR